ncbi:MAG TPA: OmpA family protein [Dongiaceae bacterium]|nr:OmpA family protein [Dongiaceae bacterium]
MKTHRHSTTKQAAVVIATVLLTACMTSPTKPEGATEARNKLMQLQSDPQLATRAPVAIKDAESAVRAAEQPQKDVALGQHLVYLADRKVEIASAQAQSRLLQDQRKSLSEQREGARLDSRTLEADNAKLDTKAAQQQNEDLQRQIVELNAKTTERGLVITLGDLLFATGKSELRGSASTHLDKLASFLNQHKDRTVVIEGHTDSVGSDGSNVSLSQRRADAVKTYLMHQSVESNRIEATGKGEGDPVATNDSASGRQQNRRVEVIIVNMATSSR